MLVQLQIPSFASVLGLGEVGRGFAGGLVPGRKMQNIVMGSTGSNQCAADSEGSTASWSDVLVMWGDKMKHGGTLAGLLLDQKQ